MLVGREREQAELSRMLAGIGPSQGAGVFLRGEAGIGKSALLQALRDEAVAGGAVVAAVAGIEGGWAPPFVAWTGLLDQLGAGTSFMAAREGEGADEHRYRLVQEIVALVRGVAIRRPVVLVLDDLQWIDRPSRDLIIPVWQGIGTARVLLSGAWRTPLAEREPDLGDLVASLYRQPGISWIEPAGLTESDLGELVAGFGWQPDEDALRQLTRRTSGNPFFATELARLGARAGADVPASVRHVISQRFTTLPEPTQQVLRWAAIMPGAVSFGLLRDLAGLDEAGLLDALEPALAAEMLHPVTGQVDAYDFSHGVAREVVAAEWSAGRRVRAHRQAADILSRQTGASPGEIARHYAASRSLAGAEQGIPAALAAGDEALAGYDFGLAADMFGIAAELASDQGPVRRGEIEVRRALALLDALRIEEGEQAAEQAVAWLREGGVSSLVLAEQCWRLAHTLNAVNARPALRNEIRDIGLAALGGRRDLPWARLRLLGDPLSTVPHPTLHVAKWDGYDPAARAIVLQRGTEEDQAQSFESFDARTPAETRDLIARARGWRHARATLRGLTVAANDLTYRQGQFRPALGIWQEVLALAEKVGAIPWQANALDQITLLQIMLGEFANATQTKYRADFVNARLGDAADADALQMERDFALTCYLDGDWTSQAEYWLDLVSGPLQGLETQLSMPLYAAMAAVATVHAATNLNQARLLLDAASNVAMVDGVLQANGITGWGGEAVYLLGDRERAVTFEALARVLMEQGVGDYPQTSLALTRARMMALQGKAETRAWYDRAIVSLRESGQRPLQGIALLERALLPGTAATIRARDLDLAGEIFANLGMTTWRERVIGAGIGPSEVDLGGLSKREIEVLGLVAQGYSDKRVADTLFISQRTVNAHMRNMLTKTDSANRTELASWAQRIGILEQQ
jgi:DNA-binding CsgD family transcriptional regulator